jgi:PadR family transcriptional regulator, regulatory protein PadR
VGYGWAEVYPKVRGSLYGRGGSSAKDIIITYSKNRYLGNRIVLIVTKNPEYRDLFPGALEMMILQSLRLKPMHGYALVKHIKQVSDNLLQIEEGSLYPALQRMLKEGWLDSKEGISAKGRPTRIYRLTNAGRRRLDQEIASFEKMFAGITRVLAVSKA